MRHKILAFIPLLFLALAVIIGYLNLPLEWFLVSTGLLVLYVVFNKGEIKEVPAANDSGSSDIKNFIEGIAEPALMYDATFKVLAFNSSAEKIFGIKKEDLIGKHIQPKDASNLSWQRFIQILYPSLSPSMINRSKEGEYPQVIDVSFASPDLEARTVTSKIGKEDGKQLFLKIIHDRTKELTGLKEKNEFVAVASHQLRTPVTSIIWAIESIVNSPSLPEELKEIAISTQENAKRLGNLVEDLLNISRMEEGRLGYNFAPVDAVEFLNKILGAVFPQAKRLGIKIFFDKPSTPVAPMYADEGKLGMAIGNLLDNAIRYNVKDGEVSMRLKEVPNQQFLEISIRDSGIGIPSEEIGKLFGKFFRATNAVKFETHGSGLGLYITQSIIQSHGGSLKVESELNKGSVFTITIPTDKSLIPPAEVPLI